MQQWVFQNLWKLKQFKHVELKSNILMYKATKNELFYAANALFFRYPTLFDVMFFRLVSLAAML